MSQRTPGGLVLLDPPGGNGNPSASQRREATLQLQLAQTNAAAQHYLTLVAILVMQLGGKATIPAEQTKLNYEIGFGTNEDGDIVYTAKPHEDEPQIVAPDGAPASATDTQPVDARMATDDEVEPGNAKKDEPS